MLANWETEYLGRTLQAETVAMKSEKTAQWVCKGAEYMAVLCERTFFSLRVKSWKTSGFSAFSDTAFLIANGTTSGAVIEQRGQ